MNRKDCKKCSMGYCKPYIPLFIAEEFYISPACLMGDGTNSIFRVWTGMSDFKDTQSFAEAVQYALTQECSLDYLRLLRIKNELE